MIRVAVCRIRSSDPVNSLWSPRCRWMDSLLGACVSVVCALQTTNSAHAAGRIPVVALPTNQHRSRLPGIRLSSTHFGGPCGRTPGPAICRTQSGGSGYSCDGWLVLILVDPEIGMARTNQRAVLAEGEIKVVHCSNRCVRRACLFGPDPLTGTEYEHRQELIRKTLKVAGTVACDFGSCSSLRNRH